MHQQSWRGMPIFDAFGNKFHLTSREMRMALPNRYVILYDLLATAILVLANVHGYLDSVNFFLAAILWFTMIQLVTGLYMGILHAGLLISRRFSKFFIYLPAVGFVALSVSTLFSNFLYALMTGAPYTFDLAIQHMFFNVAMGLLFESIFMLFVYPRVLLHIYGEESGEPTPDTQQSIARTVSIAGHKFNVGRIISISAQDHYLEVVHDAGTELLRGRLSDVTGQLTETDGISPHRSHWVARASIEGISGKSGAKMLVLTNGTEIPVARGKVAMVQEWLESR